MLRRMSRRMSRRMCITPRAANPAEAHKMSALA